MCRVSPCSRENDSRTGATGFLAYSVITPQIACLNVWRGIMDRAKALGLGPDCRMAITTLHVLNKAKTKSHCVNVPREYSRERAPRMCLQPNPVPYP
jgi:hypothetical protein